jgi:flagellar basal body-associated protein FliL
MLKRNGKSGTTIIALLIVIAALALAVFGAAYFGFSLDASWAEGV